MTRTMSYRQPSVGIVGAGQLARMMAQAAIPLDIRVVLLAASADDGAARVTPDVVVGAPDDAHALRELASQVDVITFDHELVDPALLAELEQEGVIVWPSSGSMALAQDKRRQRSELGALGLPVPAFANVDSVDDAQAFGEAYGWPIVLKASRGGYDGRGVWVLRDADEASRVVEGALASGTVLLAEEFLALDLECAMLLARRPNGEIAMYPPIETVQADGICRELRVPADLDPVLVTQAESVARQIAEHAGIVGIMAIEFFVSKGRLYVNELAPRPHNSGHWSIEGAITSQFEQHLRAVLDWPLGDTSTTSDHVVTVNLLGPGDGIDPRSNLAQALGVEGVHPHFYGKEARPGRKIGHVTATGRDASEVETRARSAHHLLVGEKGKG
jgi:5-(carboxyamino)imidazole ribonucleotide synthase